MQAYKCIDMKQYEKQNGSIILFLLSVLPTAYFICAFILRHKAGVDTPVELITPFLERMPYWVFM